MSSNTRRSHSAIIFSSSLLVILAETLYYYVYLLEKEKCVRDCDNMHRKTSDCYKRCNKQTQEHIYIFLPEQYVNYTILSGRRIVC